MRTENKLLRVSTYTFIIGVAWMAAGEQELPHQSIFNSYNLPTLELKNDCRNLHTSQQLGPRTEDPHSTRARKKGIPTFSFHLRIFSVGLVNSFQKSFYSSAYSL